MAGDVVTLELWQQAGVPDNSVPYVDPVPPTATIPPPPGGTVFRIVEFPADPEAKPYLHRTASLDYCVVLSGEVYAVLDDDERLMRTGDVLVQRGTNHGWANRSKSAALVMFVLVDAASLDD
ncbi:cupin domain-containing protein [Streptomyces malaysiensis]|uniref:cupin domain-containing protein n=1 Tax=Streptomyces malaysiensis TaxID=92644 RepID=UPI002B30C1F9|nr:cupin domain-containing protein [Streptomyces malaysiensis]